MNGLTLISIVLTIVVYIGAKWLSIRVSSPVTTPVLTATIVIIIIFYSMDITYEQYTTAKEWMTYLLGPATVALAVPLYHNRAVIMEKLIPALLGLFIGTLSTIISAVWLSKAFGLTETIQATAAVKAVTTPVAIEAVVLIGGDPALAAAFVIIAGIFGAVFASTFLNWMKITDPFSRGLGIGTVSHVIGTSQAVKEGPIQGAVSSMAMGLAAILTSIILPWLYPLIQL
ncbi:LrgB family protein [Bacillus sp. V3B]|uniref:LrgB family protein n=1 Tax=Bacillus sp. V3B TaxID=2804915 RepID=UPI00210930C1|nr:LrgB family protein [Bacillus sp. V3B]MCQ6276982.1 LrgB family protein [Bacillus sp. V3B]